MAERVESIMFDVVSQFQFPDVSLLSKADPVEIAKMGKNEDLLLKLCVSEIICKDETVRAELFATLNQMRLVSLKARPCTQALLREYASGKTTKNHDQMVKCLVDASCELNSLLEEAAEYISPHLLNLYYVRAK